MISRANCSFRYIPGLKPGFKSDIDININLVKLWDKDVATLGKEYDDGEVIAIFDHEERLPVRGDVVPLMSHQVQRVRAVEEFNRFVEDWTGPIKIRADGGVLPVSDEKTTASGKPKAVVTSEVAGVGFEPTTSGL